MKFNRLELEGLCLIELDFFKDDRGFFTERFNEAKFAENGLPLKILQSNHSRSIPGVLRGLHYQMEPSQGKLVGVVHGRVLDVAVDLRRTSPTFGKSFSVELSAENRMMLWIPGGFAHGFCVLGDEPADVLYNVDALYNPKTEGGIYWEDSELAIDWPFKNPILSAKDRKLPSFAEFREQRTR